MKQTIKRLLPQSVLRLKRSIQIAAIRRRFQHLTPTEVFTEIYRKRLWGSDASHPFCSGSGSRGRVAQEYVKFVSGFIFEHRIRSVVDLGCGDFFIGSQLASLVDSYVGVDVVPELIEYLSVKYGAPNIRFCCIDITTAEPLPAADLCLIRQVFQHLSNEQIARVLRKLDCYRFVLVTEHHPSPHRPFVPNKDKPHGPDTRLYDDSGVCLDQPPFNVAAREVLAVPAENCLIADGEMIRTYLICNSAGPTDQ